MGQRPALQNHKVPTGIAGGQEKDRFRTFFGTLGITRHLGDSTSVSLLGSSFSTSEQERYDIQGQYWLTQTETSENLGVGTYFEHARNYLKAHVESVKLLLKHTAKQHDVEAGLTWKQEHIEETSVEYEMRDSAGYSVPHTGTDLFMIYSLRARNELNANRLETYVQATWRFRSAGEHTLNTLNKSIRYSQRNNNHPAPRSTARSRASAPSTSSRAWISAST